MIKYKEIATGFPTTESTSGYYLSTEEIVSYPKEITTTEYIITSTPLTGSGTYTFPYPGTITTPLTGTILSPTTLGGMFITPKVIPNVKPTDPITGETYIDIAEKAIYVFDGETWVKIVDQVATKAAIQVEKEKVLEDIKREIGL
jgi:hypothetical protein